MYDLARTQEFDDITHVRIVGKAASAGKTVGLDLLSGKRFDVPSFPDGNDLILKLSIGSRPLAVTLF